MAWVSRFAREGVARDILTILSGDEIDLDATIGNVFAEAPLEDVIHVLAKLPDKLTLRIAKARRKCVLGNDGWQSAIWGVHTYSAGDQHFWLEKEDTDEAGLSDRRLKLYCRAAFHEEFKFLQEKVCDEGHLGWIVGPPGTGKSVTAMVFATTVDRSKWMVTWVNVRKGSKLCRCVRLIGDKRKTKVVESKGLLEVLEAEEDDARLHLVIIDGWALGINETLSTKCEEWIMRKDKKERRRLVFVCSMSSRGSWQAQYEAMTRAQELTVFSWTLDEYHAAVQDDDVFESVMENLHLFSVCLS